MTKPCFSMNARFSASTGSLLPFSEIRFVEMIEEIRLVSDDQITSRLGGAF